MSIAGLIKSKIREWVVQIGILRRPSIRYCIANELLPSVLARTPSNTVREMFNLPTTEYQTQLNQDVFALLINQFRAGYFLEIGANDGFTFSNTVYLEIDFGWKGILVEANPKYKTSLAKRKNSVLINRALSSQIGKAEFIDADLYGGLKSELDGTHRVYTKDAPKIIVDCISLQEVLNEADAPEQIDFVSIDVEGGEVPIVEQMVAVNRRFRCGCIECNNPIKTKLIVDLLESGGYKLVWENQTGHDLFFIEDNIKGVD